MTTPIYTDLQRIVPDPGIDPEVLAGVYLRHEFDTRATGYVVCNEIDPGETFAVPVVRVVTSNTDTVMRGVLDVALIEFDVFGRDREATQAAARLTRALMQAAKGVRVGSAVITTVPAEADGLGPRLEPDPELYRFGFTNELSIHPA